MDTGETKSFEENRFLWHLNNSSAFFMPKKLAQLFGIKEIVVRACNQAIRPYILVKWRSRKDCFKVLVGSRPARHPAKTKIFLSFYVPLHLL